MTAEMGTEEQSPQLEKMSGSELSPEDDEETSDELWSSDNSEPDRFLNGPSPNKTRLWDSHRDLRSLPRQSSMARRSSIKNGSMVCVEEWLEEKLPCRQQSFDKPEKSHNESDTEEIYLSDSDFDWERKYIDLKEKYNGLSIHADSLSIDVAEAIDLLREEHQALQELEEDHINMFHDLEGAKQKCERLENENAILRKRLIRKNHENYELQSKLDANSALLANKSSLENITEASCASDAFRSKNNRSHSSLPSDPRAQFRRSKSAWSVQRNPMEMLSDSPKSPAKPKLTVGESFDRRAEFQRSKSAWNAQRVPLSNSSQSKLTGVSSSPLSDRRTLSPSGKISWLLPRDPLETLSEVTKKDRIMKWFDFNIPSLEEEVGDEAQRIKKLVASSQSQSQRLDRQYLRTQSMKNLFQ